MDIEKIRNNLLSQILVALVIGIALTYLTGYALQITAPIFTYAADLMLNHYLEPSVGVSVISNIALASSHTFFSAILVSVIGLVFLQFCFQINTMFLPLVSRVSFYITSNWWFFSDIPNLFQEYSSDDILIALLGQLAAVLAWLLMSWILVRWVLPNKTLLSVKFSAAIQIYRRARR
jgi:hypothetical protein